jgi:lipid II:glycine glycyltransferase (peptidoglycan interpeptide bridge formation enzyme)
MISFLQSQVWADFQKSINRKIWRLDEALVIKHNLLFNKSYFYSPRLRFSIFGGQARCEDWINKIKQIAKQENAIFLKIEPSFAKATDGKPLYLEEFGFIKGQNIQPSKTLILNIEKTEQELLRQMHYKTRYNIGLAEKKGILIKKDKNKFEDFWRLIQETTKRDGFRPHPKEYYRKMLKISDVELFLADFKNKIIAANIVVFYEKQAIYLHGASDYEQRNLMAPFLLQWSQILEAKKRGCTEYDFWGINEKKWPGVTRFKKGFGGYEISYPGAYDLVFQPMWYKIYKISRLLLTGFR